MIAVPRGDPERAAGDAEIVVGMASCSWRTGTAAVPSGEERLA
jgi:hypothetical protein